ncbi:kinase-like domain-containing protein [Paraphoma chrysanthemicola]|uniref:non-specific serine/threonine protein kinase n=1 Tax=Paraphoma chrysanthemicola TaxID=798071 RepID=A0A8K0R486_9PLEO|nr:kinase-like domain-containing protein [Paraphoma chrysanthemicola]
MDDLRLAFQRLRRFEIAGGTHTTLSFVPEAALFELLTRREIETALKDPVFGFEPHQRRPVSIEVADGARKLFAILVELRLERRLKTCLEKNLSDSNLPILGETILHGLFPESATHFSKLQWEFVPLKLREHTHKDIEPERVLPFVENKRLSSGGYSTVFKVKVHPLYHDFEPCSGEQPEYVRKEISSRSSYEAQRRESDLLFLLRSLENDNLVRLITSYTQNGLCNLLFPIADYNLNDLLLNKSQPKWCQDSAQVVDSFRGLANGLHYLHNFRSLSEDKEEAERITRHGYHHDIKPRNILVKDKRLILADFGLARLKDVQEDTQTPWKHTPPTYAAPEARDPDTLQEREVGRAYDIWSFGCVLGEIATYHFEGADGVRAFRKERIVEAAYGSNNCFHHNGNINPGVDNWYHKMKDTYKCSCRSHLFDTSSWLLVIDPKQRPTSAELVQSFNVSSLSLWKRNVLNRIALESCKVSERLPAVYKSKLRLERDRLLAWGYSLGLTPPVADAGQMQAPIPDLGDQYDSMVHLLKNCSLKLETLQCLHTEDTDAQEQVLQTITSTNDALFLGTSDSLKKTIENNFRLLTSSAVEIVKLLHDNNNATALETGTKFPRNDRNNGENTPLRSLSALLVTAMVCVAHVAIGVRR